jgi:hypothetical protein
MPGRDSGFDQVIGKSPESQILAMAAAVAVAAVTLTWSLVHSPAPDVASPFAGPDGQVAAERAYGKAPLAFERDAGRSGPRVDFLARGSAGTTFIGSTGATLALHDGKRTEALRLALPGASPAAPEAIDRLPGVVNDLVGDERSQWSTDIPTFERIRYPNVYPGTSLEWYGNQRHLEYDFRLAPGADPDRIAIELRGAENLRVAANGDLEVDTGRASIRQRAPIAYQTIAGERRLVEASFAVDGKQQSVGFDLGAYDRSRPLVIDPVLLAYSTYLGGTTGGTSGNGIAVDSSGAAYVTGFTTASDFNTVNSIEGDQPGFDVFVSKLTPSGSGLSYSTYIGGNDSEDATGIEVDSSGAAYVAGLTASTDFNVTGEAGVGHIEGDSGDSDAFVFKLTPAGSSLSYSTYLGGGAIDSARDVAVDSSGAAYVTGRTDSTDFNTTGTAGVGHIEGDADGSDAFISKLAPSGGSLVYSTYLGGDGADFGKGIAVDSSGAAYATGETTSTDFNTVGAIEGNSDDPWDAFVSKLSPAGNALAYSTYLGGNGVDFPNAIAVDSSGAAYVAGETASTDFNTVGAIEGDSGDGSFDAFVAKLASSGGALSYSTYLGGNSDDMARGIAIDSAGAAYVTGETGSSDFNASGGIEGDSTDRDAFVSKLTTDGGSLVYSTYLGGSSWEGGNAIAVDSAGSAYVTGQTASTDFDTVTPIEGNGDFADAFVSKLAADSDNDGVPDSSDACPSEPGQASNGGCPAQDSDGDGVPDTSDGCPSASGPVSNAGCPVPPDSDSDGVRDFVDGCPNVPGPATNNGCPLPSPSGDESNSGGNGETTSDADPPDGAITAGPKKRTQSARARFKFRSDEAGSEFECKLDGKPFKECSSPHAYKGIGPGKHRFRLQATDSVGNIDPTPAIWKWTVVR